MSEYLKMESWGNLESTVNELLDYKNKGILVYTDFNGTILYSDTVNNGRCLFKNYRQN